MDVPQHEAKCTYNLVECPNYQSCRSKVTTFDLPSHLQKCRTMKCRYCHHLQKNVELHEDYECVMNVKRFVKCTYCGVEVTRAQVSDHMTSCSAIGKMVVENDRMEQNLQ